MRWNTFKTDNYSTVGGAWGDVGVSEVRASATSPMPDHKRFKLLEQSEIHPLHFQVELSEI